MKKLYLLLLLLTPILSIGQFTVTDAAVADGCNCFELSNDATSNTVGSFYNNTPVDLTGDLKLKFTVNFGCDNFGGEGMAFVLQSGPWTVGGSGHGLGYQGITNSVAIEFDTRDNNLSGEYPAGNDVGPDHISIQADGNINHGSATNNLGPTTPVNIISTGSNDAEDCQDHNIEINWIAAAQTLDVLVDGTSIYPAPQNVGDIVTDWFGGNPNVLWGWTGTTGVTANTQTVCMALDPQISFTPTNCPGQQIDFTGGYFSNNVVTNFLWDFNGLGTSILQNPSFTFNTVGEHPVTLTLTDANGCTNSETINVGIGFEVDVTADNLSVCPGGTSQLTALAQPYVSDECCFTLTLTDTWDSWNNEIEVFENGNSLGTYQIIGAPTGAPNQQTYELCFPQGAVISVEIDGQQNQFESGYSITDAENNIMIQVLPGLTWVDGDIQTFTVDCGLATTVYTYNWDNDPTLSNYNIENPIATVPNTGYYVVNVTDPGTNCVISDSIQITTTDSVKAEISGADVACQGGTGDLTVTFEGDGPYDFEYNGPSGAVTVTNITANPYTLTVSEAGNYTLNSVIGNGCNGTIITSGPDGGTGVITIITPPTVSIAANASYCAGDVINDLTVTSANGGTVNWYTNPALTGTPIGNGNTFTPTVTTASTTIYYAQEVETISGLNCAGPSDNVTIVINAIPNAPLVSGATEYCMGDTPTPLSAEMSLGGTANWYDNSNLNPPTISNALQYTPTLAVGTSCYYVNETAAGCTGDSTEICITTKPTPVAPTLTGATTYCEGDTPTPLTANATLGGDITWFNVTPSVIGNGQNYTPDLTLGNQTFTASETLNGCTGPSASISITVNILPIVNIPANLSLCYGDSIQVTATHNNFDLLWSNGDTTETTWLTPDTTSIHFISATNPLCGTVTDSLLITVNSLPYVNAGNDTVIGIGGEATLWAWSEGVDSYSWSPAVDECITSNCSEVYVIPNQATVYVVEVIDQNSCHNYDTVLVDISGFMEVFIPNIFSPNGDGFNDYFVVDGPRLFNFKLEVYDRWGKKIFITEDQKDHWDGKFNGTELSSQTFVYSVVGETVLGEKIVRSGNVTIIK